ncbi:hypothetical protein B0H12DRAFT_204760 [Mycena haematopus]|nr:hypothetical protein B0H12DRAFT_204760 [Mycena haematopus]
MYHDHDPMNWRRAYQPRIHIDTDSGWSPPTIEPSTLPPQITFDPPSPESGWMDHASPQSDIDIAIGSVDFDFDDSCFDALDEQLLLHPVQSFADVCWADAVQNRRASSLSVVSVTATLNSRREPEREQDSEPAQQQPIAHTRTRRPRTGPRPEPRAAASVRWADAEASHEGVHRSRSAADLREISESTALIAPPPPFSDKLNVAPPKQQQQQPLVAEPFPLLVRSLCRSSSPFFISFPFFNP